MVEQYGKQISQSGGIGIADYVKRELLKLQEV
jgi:Rod binding domain-containing protein